MLGVPLVQLELGILSIVGTGPTIIFNGISAYAPILSVILIVTGYVPTVVGEPLKEPISFPVSYKIKPLGNVPVIT